MPNSDEAKRNIKNAHHIYAQYDEFVSIFIANELFATLRTYNILIIKSDRHGQRRIFVELPVFDRLSTGTPRTFWVEAESEFAQRWHDLILDTLGEKKPSANPFVKISD